MGNFYPTRFIRRPPVIRLQPHKTGCNNAPIVINNNSTWIPSYLLHDSVAWNFCNGDISQDYDGTTTYDTIGKYSVMLIMKVMNCIRSKTAEIQIIDEVGIEQLKIDNGELIMEN